MLGPYLDEIELLLFESAGCDALPSGPVIAELGRLAGEFDLSYNVHLPTDISIGDLNLDRQRDAVETLVRVIELVQPLCPSALILHVPYIDESLKDDNSKRWQDRVYKNLEKILAVVENRKIIAIETLEYPLELLETVIVDLDLSICLDLGHLMVYGYDVKEVFNQYALRTSVLHLHGVEHNRDHTTVSRLSPELIETVLGVLMRFSGVVSLEVFSYDDLISSLQFLENHWERGLPLV
jgi:sugar phosphate isomerase/epimerase